MNLLYYDGSPDAQAAIDHAGELRSGQPAIVLTICEPFVEVMARSGAGFRPRAPMNYKEIDSDSEQATAQRAQEGAERARRAGLDPQPRARTSHGTVADTILSEADEVGASAIVIGTRGRTGLKSMLLGSVSHALIQHADRAVIVVPSAEVAAERAAHRR